MRLGVILHILPIILESHGDLISIVTHNHLCLDGVNQCPGCNMVIVCKDIPVSVPDVRCKVLEDFLQF